MSEEIRWIYRFENFRRAFSLLNSALALDTLSDLEREGMIQRFEYTFELAWKTIKDRLAYEGTRVESGNPRPVIRTAFQSGLIDDGQTWIDMLEHRNVMSHQYDEAAFLDVEENIRHNYIFALERFYESFNEAATHS